MKDLSGYQLIELRNLLAEINKLCNEYCHISDLEPVKRIIKIADSNYQKADNILTERKNSTQFFNNI